MFSNVIEKGPPRTNRPSIAAAAPATNHGDDHEVIETAIYRLLANPCVDGDGSRRGQM
jgi:hypothetical protein